MKRQSPFVVSVLATLAAALTAPEAALEAPPGFVVENAFPLAVFENPLQVVFLPDGRKLVADRRGTVDVILQDGTHVRNFIDLRDEVAGMLDLGLLGVAIDPDFASNRWVYFGYTVDPNEDGVDNDLHHFVRVARYQASLADTNVVDYSSREVLIGATWPTGPPTLFTSHSVGSLRFGLDKSLLISVGDGGHFDTLDAGGLDPDGFGPGKTDPAEDMGAFRARSLNSMAGKILRIDKETGFGLDSNPYWDGVPTSDRSRVWAYGLRNAYRFSFRPGTGSTDPSDGDPGVIYAADVGWGKWEELCIIRQGGRNHGWPCWHGPEVHSGYVFVSETEAGNDSILCTEELNYENPTAESLPSLWIHHNVGAESYPPGWVSLAIIGGDFYTGTEYPEEYQGKYFLADYSWSWIRWVEVDVFNNIVDWGDFIEGASGPVDIESDPATGDLYYVAWGAKQVRRIRWEGISSSEGAEGRAGAPNGMSLSAYPNPFRRTALLNFELPAGGEASIRVYDAGGRLIRTLAERRVYPAGHQALEWDGLDSAGRKAGPGVYFCRIEAGGRTESAKVTLR
jgi:glucose/arabinose dehydrogenase